MTLSIHPRSGRGTSLGWSAVTATALAVLAWSACCVLPAALSLAGLSLAGTAVLAGSRTWVTVGAALVLAAGWWSLWRRRRACEADAACAPPSRLSIWLLSAATGLMALALIWRPLIEPKALMILRGFGA